MAAFTKILGRRDKSVVPLLSMYLKYNKNAHSMYGCECHAAIAKPPAAVTRVQSPSQEVGSGDNGLGLLCFDFVISRNGLLVAGGRAVVEASLLLSTKNVRHL